MTLHAELQRIRDAPTVRYNAGEVCTDTARLAESIRRRLEHPRTEARARLDLDRALAALAPAPDA